VLNDAGIAFDDDLVLVEIWGVEMGGCNDDLVVVGTGGDVADVIPDDVFFIGIVKLVGWTGIGLVGCWFVVCPNDNPLELSPENAFEEVIDEFVNGVLLVDKEPKAESKSPNALCETEGVGTGAEIGLVVPAAAGVCA
jgi:hypothetical protein